MELVDTVQNKGVPCLEVQPHMLSGVYLGTHQVREPGLFLIPLQDRVGSAVIRPVVRLGS